MTAAPATATRLARLLADAFRDREALEARAADVRRLTELSSQRALTRDEVVVLAVHLHGWYTALEAFLERVARLVDETVPSGSAWHSDLVVQMCVEVPGLRPRVLDPELEIPIAELRKFRHFFRNAYVLELDPKRVLEVATVLHAVHATCIAGLDGLGVHLRAVLAELAR